MICPAANVGTAVGHERIYQHVWKDKKDGGALHLHLRHGGKKCNKRKGKNSGRGLIPNRVDIDQRRFIVLPQRPRLRRGAKVLLTSGPFAGHIGIYDGQPRMRVCTTKMLATQLDRRQNVNQRYYLRTKKVTVVTGLTGGYGWGV
jgi:hypothetical protein